MAELSFNEYIQKLEDEELNPIIARNKKNENLVIVDYYEERHSMFQVTDVIIIREDGSMNRVVTRDIYNFEWWYENGKDNQYLTFYVNRKEQRRGTIYEIDIDKEEVNKVGTYYEEDET